MLGASVEGTVKGLGSRVVGGSWVVISGVASPSVRIITIVILLITLLITNHEPPSKPN